MEHRLAAAIDAHEKVVPSSLVRKETKNRRLRAKPLRRGATGPRTVVMPEQSGSVRYGVQAVTTAISNPSGRDIGRIMRGRGEVRAILPWVGFSRFFLTLQRPLVNGDAGRPYQELLSKSCD